MRATAILLTLLTASLRADPVEGVVLDTETGEAIAGVNVHLAGTEVGATTDSSGTFRIAWTGAYPLTLRVSHVAYLAKEVHVSRPASLRIRLAPQVIPGREVTVTGERATMSAVGSVARDVVGAEEMEVQGAREVGAALRKISSVMVDQGNTGVQAVSIRGSNPNEVAVFLDGIRLNSNTTGVADLAAVDFQGLERIEVLRGGGAYLYGLGNLGGVVNLESRGVDGNSLSAWVGDGLSSEKDSDLSVSGSLKFGRLGAGGRISNRSRAYGGRTVTESGFRHLFAETTLPSSRLSGRWLRQDNRWIYPSGFVAAGDEQETGVLRFRGDIAVNGAWDLSAHRRRWSHRNDFFETMTQTLADAGDGVRLSRGFRLHVVDGTVQAEMGRQTLHGARVIRDPELGSETERATDFSRDAFGYTLVTRWVTEGGTPLLRTLTMEVSMRRDDVITRQEVVETVTGVGGSGESPLIHAADRTAFSNRKMGLRLEGLSSQFGYRLFFTQTSNRRPPTLNDLFVHGTTSVDTLRKLPLEPETLSATEVNLEVSFTEFLTTPIVSDLTFSGAYFWNNYDSKLGYKVLKGVQEPPFPFNELQADIRGYEAGVELSLLDGRVTAGREVTVMDLENPYLFPNRPSSRRVTSVAVNGEWWTASWDHFNEGEQFVVGSVAGQILKPRENAAVSLHFRRKIGPVEASLNWTAQNWLSRGKRGDEEEVDPLLFNYFDQYRESVTLRLSL